ncbi:DUF1353 domain-containing protein [candidate division KSB1 bacterium]|nr:DUF1353 domain-containing protein [candidate division KSB1 bacterium]
MNIYSLKNARLTIEKSPFPPVKVTYITEEDEWELVERYSVQVSGYDFDIPEGFRFDLASIPRVVWWLIAPFELSLVAPLVHDFMYEYEGQVPSESVEPDHIFERKEADDIFRELMKLEGVPEWRVILAYNATRWFGGLYWGT